MTEKEDRFPNRKRKKLFCRAVMGVLLFAYILLCIEICDISFAFATNMSDEISDIVVSDKKEESFLFYGKETNEAEIKSNFISVSLIATEEGTQIDSIKNLSSDFDWINGKSIAELPAVYHDASNILQNFEWEYFGYYISDSSEKVIFEYKSKNGIFISRQEWSISRNDEDGSLLLISSSIESLENVNITLPERFSGINMMFCSKEDYYVQYLDKVITSQIVNQTDVIQFKAGNVESFDMSVPLFYFNATGVHGIAVGMGSFSPDEGSVLNVAISDKGLIFNTDTCYKKIIDDTNVVYCYPSMFVAVYDGNNNIGKNFVKNANLSMTDKFGSLPIAYANVVGEFNAESVEKIRDCFYNMMFHFSVNEVCRNKCDIIKDSLLQCRPEDSSRYKYILRSAILCDFDYTKIGLTDGTEIKKSAAEHDDLYRSRLASIMLSGRQYAIFEGYNSDGWDGIEFYDSVNKKGAVFVFRDSTERMMQKVIAIQGVNPEMEYKVSSVDGSVNIEKITGAELLSGGLTISMSGNSLSDIVFIEEAEVDFADVKVLLFGNELSSLELIAIAAIFVFVIGFVITAIIINAEDEYIEKKF